jgi:hypothetical protein
VIKADCRCLQRLEGTKSTGSSSQAPLLEITVSDPVKQGDGVQAYVSYRVSTKVSDACSFANETGFLKGSFIVFISLSLGGSVPGTGYFVAYIPSRTYYQIHLNIRS